MTDTNVNVINVLEVSAEDLSTWCSFTMLNLMLPEVTPNSSPTPDQLFALLPRIANNIVVLTTLCNLCVGSKAPHSVERKTAGFKSDAANTVTLLGSKISILEKTLKALESQRDVAGRMLTKLTSSKYTTSYPTHG